MSKRTKQVIFVGLAVVLIAFAAWSIRPQGTAAVATPSTGSGPAAPAAQSGPSASQEAQRLLAELEDKARQNPKDVKALTELADYLLDQRLFARAADTYSSILDIEPQNLDIRTRLATAYFFQGMTKSAIKEYRSIIEAEPTKIEAHYYLALALSHSEPPDVEGAVNSWKEVVKQAPDSEMGKKAQTFIEAYQKQEK